jgi:gliding motility-associated-like protein
MFTPKLVVRDAAGCLDSVSLTNFVKISVLTADFNFTRQACLGSPVNFTSLTQGNPTSSIWTFGDNGPSVTQSSGQYIYKDTGIYAIKLLVADEFGCKDSVQSDRAIQVAKPVAAFNVNDSISFCPPFEVQFTNRSTFISTVDWNFENLGTSTELNPKLVLTAPNKYNVRLKVVSPDGNCSDSAFKTLQLYRPEDAELTYTPTDVCIPGTVTLSAFAKYASAKFFWDFGDGNILDTSINEVTHVYTDFGNFTPKIILTESSGCILPIAGIQPVKVHGAIAKFAIDKQFFCDEGLISLTDSTLFNEPIVRYNWDFGDNTTSNVQSPRHQYTAPGIYTVSLNVQTQSGCTDTMTLKTPVKIVASPSISITGDSIICVNDQLLSSGVFNRVDTSKVQWVWQFPNGNRSTIQLPPPQKYITAGSFVVAAVATNSSGCTDTATKNILVNPLPTVTMPSTLTKQVGFPIDIPAVYTSNVTDYSWTPSTGLSCNDCPQPTLTTKFDTKYTVSFVDSNGCKNTGDIQVIVICKNANIFVPNTFSPNGDGSNDVFIVRGRGLDRVKSLRIFNRWGEVVFEKRDFAVNDPSAGWDGRYKGNKPQADVYVYQVEIFCENSQVIRFEGNIALIQ